MSRHESGGGTVLLAFLAGAVSGAAVALLFAPAAGEETRQFLTDKARESRERALQAAREGRETLEAAEESAGHGYRTRPRRVHQGAGGRGVGVTDWSAIFLGVIALAVTRHGGYPGGHRRLRRPPGSPRRRAGHAGRPRDQAAAVAPQRDWRGGRARDGAGRGAGGACRPPVCRRDACASRKPRRPLQSAIVAPAREGLALHHRRARGLRGLQGHAAGRPVGPRRRPPRKTIRCSSGRRRAASRSAR